ncbi:hypothetical protein F5Y10DRAFT_273761 [Nemania abortiva]|nr:hypothetical protein F5Y10DRAFT_273761 [Nemania abortiva]
MGPGPQWDPLGKSQMARDARFAALKWYETGAGSRKDANVGAQGHTHALGRKLTRVQSCEAAVEAICQTIAVKLVAIFMLPADDINLRQSPTQYGVDSFVAVELCNMLVLQDGAIISIFNIMQSSTLAALTLDIVR